MVDRTLARSSKRRSSGGVVTPTTWVRQGTVPDRRRDFCQALSLVALVGLLALLSASPMFAQGPADLETFEDRTSVTEVQIPVNVVSRDGQPVRGLTAADFEIIDNGQSQEITNIRVVDLAEISPDPSRPSEVEAAVPSSARRNFLFLFDLSFSRPANIVRARQAAQEFVANNLHPTDLAAVAVHSVESGTNLVVTFTPDRVQLARAIDTLGAPRLLKQIAKDPLRFVIDTPEADAGIAVADNNTNRPLGEMESISSYLSVIGTQMNRMEKSYQRGQIERWTQSMGNMARILSSIKGRKHVVLFSEGFDGRLVLGRQPDKDDPEAERDYFAIQDGNYHLVDTDDTFGNTIVQNSLNMMLGEFRRADCLIQVVDISGLRADLPSENRRRRVNDEVLFYLANETGGELFEDGNDFGTQLAEVLERSSVTYVLTFKPKDLVADGSHHRIKVRANVPRGTRLSHRDGYYAPRPFTDLHPLEKNLLAGDLIASATPKADLDLNVLAAPFRANPEAAYVPVIVEIPGTDLLVDHESRSLPVEFYTYVTDDKGEMKDFFTQLVTIDLENRRDLFSQTGIKYYGHLDLKPGDYLVRVLARNALTGRTGVETLALSVPEYMASEPQLLPPFFVEQPGTWFLVKEQGSEYAKTTVYPFTVNGMPYVPAAFPALNAEPADLCLVAYNMGEGDLEVSGVVRGPDGSTIDAGVLDIGERTVTGIEGLDKLTATFDPRGLSEGEYTLEVSILDPSTQSRQINSMPFRIGGRDAL